MQLRGLGYSMQPDTCLPRDTRSAPSGHLCAGKLGDIDTDRLHDSGGGGKLLDDEWESTSAMCTDTSATSVKGDSTIALCGSPAMWQSIDDDCFMLMWFDRRDCRMIL